MTRILALSVDENRPVRRGSAYMWTVVRDLTAANRTRVFTAAEVLLRTDRTEPSTVRKWLRTLVKAGFLAEAAGGFVVVKRPPTLPHISNDGRIVPSRTDAMWVAMRALKVFTPRELALAASTEEALIEEWTAKSYIVQLHAAGYFALVSKATSRRQASYRLKPSMDGGPLAPRILRTKLVYDPNRDQVMGEAETEEVCP